MEICLLKHKTFHMIRMQFNKKGLTRSRTDNEIKNYWNTRIKRRQRAGLPLYPPEIQRELAMNAQARMKDVPKQTIPNTCASQSFPALNNTLFNNISTMENNNVNYLIGNFNRSSQLQHLQSPPFPVKMELPLTQVFQSYSDNQKLLPPPPLMGHGSNGLLFEDLFPEPQGMGEMFDEGLLANPLLAGCAAMAEPLPQPLPQPLPHSFNFKHPVMGPLCKPYNSNFFARGTMNQQVFLNNDVSQLLEMNPTPTTPIETEKLLTNWCDSAPSPGVNDNNINVHIDRMSSNVFKPPDMNHGSSSWVKRN